MSTTFTCSIKRPLHCSLISTNWQRIPLLPSDQTLMSTSEMTLTPSTTSTCFNLKKLLDCYREVWLVFKIIGNTPTHIWIGDNVRTALTNSVQCFTINDSHNIYALYLEVCQQLCWHCTGVHVTRRGSNQMIWYWNTAVILKFKTLATPLNKYVVKFQIVVTGLHKSYKLVIHR